MPIIKSAKKKLRKDIKKTKQNTKHKIELEKILKAAKKNKSASEFNKILKEAYSKIDKTVKKNLMHKNKASRLKSKIAKLASKLK